MTKGNDGDAKARLSVTLCVGVVNRSLKLSLSEMRSRNERAYFFRAINLNKRIIRKRNGIMFVLLPLSGRHGSTNENDPV